MNSKYGFIGKNEKVYLTCCPKCGLENYAMNVSSGFCTWCGYDGNKDEESLLFSIKKLKDDV
jgi:ribosomal protein L37E